MSVIPIVMGTLATVTKVQEQEDLEIRGREDQSNYSITAIGQNTKESPLILEETSSHSNSSEKLSAKFVVKNL